MSDKECEDRQGEGVNRRRSTIVSFSKDKDEISIDGDRDDEDYQMALAPYIQSYLEHSVETVECCGIGLPVPFERASRRSWWDPRFDSEILEGQYRKSSFSQIRLRFRYALVYLIVLTVCWSLYLTALGVLDKSFTDAFPLGLIYFFFVILSSLVLLFTRSSLYRQHMLPASVLITLAMCALSLASVSQTPVLSPASDFAICVEILMIIYTVIPLPLYLIVLISSAYSVVFELLGVGFWPAKIFLHVSVHLIGLHIFIMTNVRMRGTFMKVGQSLLVRRQLEMEKQLKEKMIHSVMPQDVARWLLEEEGGQFVSDDIDSLFRPFKMSCMKDVSILFADIVGFTKMSSNKTASQLVTVLNELFERFDELCVHNGCEKIATLGDCYYCVSGCPTARQDHAQCCVEMGLGMIRAISEFDEEKHEDINMRVGVHTGTVLCGIVGRRRFKFDVWGNDVTLANKMESSGRPGQVHISEATRRFLGDLYILERGEEYHGLDTFFIISRKHDIIIEDTTQATITSLTSNTLMTTEPSFETALMSNADSLVTAQSQTRSAKSSSQVNCTISPFDAITDSRLFSEMSTTPSPPSNLPHLLCLSETLPEDVKATSLPNVFARDTNASSRPSILGSGPLLTRKPLPSWKYSRLKLNSLDVENGKIQKTYKVSSSGHPSPVDKVLAPNNQLEVPKDDLSFCHSLNSRKDSGIRSCNSRRSSIQHQIFALNGVQSDLMNHRVSGYYTSSQSSLNGSFQGKYKNACKLPAPLTDSLGACFQKIRKQSDLQLIRCVQDNSKSERNYFVTPPLKRWSLLFKYPDMEKEYREKAHRASPRGANYSRTLATARFNTYFDITISFIVFSSVSLSLFILFSLNIPWMTTFLLLLGIQLAVISLCLYSIVMPVVTKRLAPFLNWYPWHAIGGILVSLPVIAVLSNYEFSSISKDSIFVYSCAIFVGLVHYCNFTQLNCWMKSACATLGGFIYLILATSTVLAKPQLWAVGNATFDDYDLTNVGFSSAMQFLYDPSDFPPKYPHSPDDKLPPGFALTDSQVETLRRSYFFIAETYLSVFLVVLLVWFLNREFEISYRLSFHGNAVAAKDKAKVEKMKVQAEELLYNIIPKHVAEHLKTTARYRYSEDIKNIGIIFASVINFGEMYDESYMDGRECLRVLNELVSDFDDLLSKEQFSMVEKIKTIGATFMAASGLNPSERKQESNEHLFQLMEFAFALQNAMENFNTHLLSFKFILRVGFNFGDVTAGVIGTNKLHYDIWGDAVNIASRMDTTGMANRIQVPVSCIPVLSQRYRLEHRGTVFVKGKDNMDVYLIKDRIEPPSENVDSKNNSKN